MYVCYSSNFSSTRNNYMEVLRIFDLLDNYIEKYSSKSDTIAAKENGRWKNYNTKEFIDYATNFAYGLLALGICRNDKIIIISNNRPEWNFADFGIQMAGAVSVPVYPTVSENDLKFILHDVEVKYILVSNDVLFWKVKSASSGISSIQEIFTFDNIRRTKHWSEITERGKKNPMPEKLKTIKDSIKAQDLVTILYTSGTTGNPKGVMLSHDNIVSNFKATEKLPPIDHTCRALSFLPLNHVYERMLTYLYMYLGVSIYYAESMDTIGDNLREVKPHVFSAVPRLLEKVYDKIVTKGNELKGIKKKLFFWALNLGLHYELDGKNGWWYEFQLRIANKIIFSKWREALGGNVRALISGAAPLQPRLIRIFCSAKIPVLEGYGLTETSPVISVNHFNGGTKFGTVGPVLKNVHVKIADDGEILCKGPNVMLGYYKQPDATTEVIDKDGWFHTGDIGIFEDEKFLKITDRKKEIFKTSGGKYIAPQPIENKLKESPFIEQAMVIGDGQKFAAALIVPSFIYIKKHLAKEGITVSSNEEIIRHPKVMEIIHGEVEEKNKSFGHWETIKKFELMPNEWSIDKGEMTPTLKLKRKIILTANKELIDKIFGIVE
ncbi:MAG: AMP-dependent synthetase/ligase [Bacteroidota bacterium]